MEIINVAEFIDIMKIKANCKRIPFANILAFTPLDPLPYEPAEEDDINDEEDAYEEENGENEMENNTEDHQSDSQTKANEHSDDKDSGIQMTLF